ncbi:Uncharacterised protein [Yersinia frederiksenii]|nr:Uncharacterised protein [Yersinia frederiksenii]
MGILLKRVDVEVIYPDGRVINGYSRCFPDNTRQVLYQIWIEESGDISYIVNMNLAESIKLTPTFEK